MKKLVVLFFTVFFSVAIVYFTMFMPHDEFVESDAYDAIIQRGRIKVGINPDSKPFGFINEKGEYAGYDVDLARYISQYILKSPDRVEFIPITPSNRLIKASTGEVDIVISTVTITPQRQEVVSFSVPYDVAGQAILVKKNSSVSSIADLAGENVGVIFGTTAERNMKNLVPTANLIGFRSYGDAYQALKEGRINALTSDDTILSRFVLNDSTVKMLPRRYSKEPYGIAFKKGNSTIKLKESLDFAIKDMQNKNVLVRLHKKWM